MLRRNMKQLSQHLRLGLEDLLGDLWHARRREDLGRLALVSYYEVRRWARLSGRQRLVEQASVIVAGRPYVDRSSFLGQVDTLISELEQELACDRQGSSLQVVPLWRAGADQSAVSRLDERSAAAGEPTFAATAGRRNAA